MADSNSKIAWHRAQLKKNRAMLKRLEIARFTVGHDKVGETQKTIDEAKKLFAALNRPNVMIKIPATPQGIPAIEECIAAGLNIKFPFFNPVQKAHAAQADADSIVAHKEADLTRYKVGEDTLRLQRSLRQLQAARDVAKLEWQVSVGDLAGVQARMQTGNANLRDAQLAQLDVNDKFAAYLDAEFELTRTELQLLRLTGELENWAIPTP